MHLSVMQYLLKTIDTFQFFSKCSFLTGHLDFGHKQIHTRGKKMLDSLPPPTVIICICGHLHTLWLDVNSTVIRKLSRKERMADGWLMSSDARSAPFSFGATVWRGGKLPKKLFPWPVRVVNSSKQGPWLAAGAWAWQETWGWAAL